MGRWDNADPAAVLESFDVRPSRNVFDADLAADLLVSLLTGQSNRSNASKNIRLAGAALQWAGAVSATFLTSLSG